MIPETLLTILGWVRKLTGPRNQTIDLTLIRDIAGPASREFGLLISDQIKYWRLKNLTRISRKYEELKRDRGLSGENIRHLRMSVGLPILEKASFEDDDDLQQLWANLILSATSSAESYEDVDANHKTFANALHSMSKVDCRVLEVVVEKGVESQGCNVIRLNNLTEEDVQHETKIPLKCLGMPLEKLVSLGLAYRDVKSPLEPGGPLGLKHVYAPTLLGINMYEACGNAPKWAEVGPEAGLRLVG